MIIIGKRIYEEFAEQLIEQIGDTNYYRGVVEIDSKELYGSLRLTAVVYREPLLDPTDLTQSATQTTEIAPVWWDMQTFQQCGEVDNTFSWQEFSHYLRALL